MITHVTLIQGRSDLANAKVAGLSDELHISPQGYSNAATILLVGYILFQLPGTLLIKQIGPARQFAATMMTVRNSNKAAVAHQVTNVI